MSPDLTDAQLRAFLEEGLSQREIARRTGIPRSTLQLRIKALTLQGGPSTVDRPPRTMTRPPSTVDASTWEMRELKHSVRWTVYVPLAMKEDIQRLARERHQPPSVVLQELLWKALHDRPT